jgi:choline kinase
MLAAYSAGVRSFVVVVEERGWAMHERFTPPWSSEVEIRWLWNQESEKSNGVSALKARDALSEPFLLLMADHLFEPGAASELLQQPVNAGQVILAVDRKLDQVFDMEDATKVLLQGDLVAEIGKEIPRFDAVDTGMFLCDPALFAALQESLQCGDCSLTDGMRRLARRGGLRAWDIGGRLWLDVDTPEALARGEQMLRGGSLSSAGAVFP